MTNYFKVMKGFSEKKKIIKMGTFYDMPSLALGAYEPKAFYLIVFLVVNSSTNALMSSSVGPL